MGLFQTLEAGKRALLSQQLALSTIGQNIANVNTPGYSRQRVKLTASQPLSTGLGLIGSGVQVQDVRQVRDLFLGAQLRQENKSLGRWQFREKIISQMETMFNEPSETSLRTHLDDLFNSFSQLENAPESNTARTDIIAKAVTLTNDFRQLSAQLNSLRDSVDRDLGNRVGEVNRLSAEIADLNQQVARMELGGNRANDIRDRRDLLIDQLSDLVDVNVIEDTNGAARVYIGSMALVDGNIQYEIATKTETIQGKQKSSIVLKGTDVVIKNLNGELRGLVETRDEVIPNYLNQLDELARTIATEVNKVHSAGFGLKSVGALSAPTGNNFFDPASVSAQTFAVDLGVLNDVSLIAASKSGEPGDASNALELSKMRSQRLLGGGAKTFNEFYGSLVGGVGVEARQAKNFRANFQLVVEQITASKESVQGVSLDEEMTNLIRAQHAYDAAARVITTVDQAFDTVINSMGIVGR
jgi:flagellar hook-associated protein 1